MTDTLHAIAQDVRLICDVLLMLGAWIVAMVLIERACKRGRS